MAIDDRFLRQFRTSEFGKGREEIARIDHVVRHLAGGSDAGPVHDQRHEAAAFLHGTLRTRDCPAADGGSFCLAVRSAVVADEYDQRVLAQFQALEFGHKLADEFVHVDDVVGIDVFAVGGAVRSRQDFAMNVRERIVHVKWLLAMLGDEVDEVFVHHIRHIFFVVELCRLTVDFVSFPFVLCVPVDSAPLEFQIIVEAELGGAEGQLAPFANTRRGVSC